MLNFILIDVIFLMEGNTSAKGITGLIPLKIGVIMEVKAETTHKRTCSNVHSTCANRCLHL